MKRLLTASLFLIIFTALFCGICLAEGEPTLVKSYGEIGDGVTAELFSDGELIIKLSNDATETASGRMNDFKKPTAPFSKDKDSITSMTIEEGVTRIGDYAFYGLNTLSSFTVSRDVREIGVGIFTNCEIANFYYTGTVADWCSLTFEAKNSNPIVYSDNFYIGGNDASNLVIPDGVTAVSRYAFYNYSSLKTLVVPNSVSFIADEAFNGCSGLQSLSVPSNVSLGTNALVFTDGIESVALTASEGGSVLSGKLLRMYQSVNPVLSHRGFNISLNESMIDVLLASYSSEEDSPTLTVSLSDDNNGATRVTKIAFDILNKSGVSVFSFTGGVPVVFNLEEGEYDSFEYSGKHSDISYDNELSLVTVTASEAGELTATASLYEKPEFSGAYISLGENISLIYRTKLPDGCEIVDFTVSFEGEAYSLAPVFVDTGVYDFRFSNIMPYQMGDLADATVTVRYGDGTEICVEKLGMSVRKYCELALKFYESDTKLVTLLSDMLVYGARAQEYRSYKTDALVTEGFEGLAPSEYDRAESAYEVIGDADDRFLGASLYLTDTLGVYLRVKSMDENAKVRLTVASRVKEYSLSALVSDDGMYGILYTGIMAYEFDSVITAELISSDTGEVLSTLKYSVLSYVTENDENADEMLSELVKAMQNYGISAKSYRGGK